MVSPYRHPSGQPTNTVRLRIGHIYLLAYLFMDWSSLIYLFSSLYSSNILWYEMKMLIHKINYHTTLSGRSILPLLKNVTKNIIETVITAGCRWTLKRELEKSKQCFMIYDVILSILSGVARKLWLGANSVRFCTHLLLLGGGWRCTCLTGWIEGEARTKGKKRPRIEGKTWI